LHIPVHPGGFRADKRGAIPDRLAPIVERLGFNRIEVGETVRGFRRPFKRAAGRSSPVARCSSFRPKIVGNGADQQRLIDGVEQVVIRQV
jgi:hypothetical protein